jgi:hypothetical protein
MKRIIVTIRPPLPAQYAPPANRGDAHRDFGFRPAYFDFATGAIHLSRFPDGRVAPLHLLDGLPDDAVIVRSACGRVVSTKSSIVPGYERNGFFYTRSAAARAVREWRLAARPL